MVKISGTGMAGVTVEFTLKVEPDGDGSTAIIDASFKGTMIVGAIGKAVEEGQGGPRGVAGEVRRAGGLIRMTTPTVEFDASGLGEWTDRSASRSPPSASPSTPRRPTTPSKRHRRRRGRHPGVRHRPGVHRRWHRRPVRRPRRLLMKRRPRRAGLPLPPADRPGDDLVVAGQAARLARAGRTAPPSSSTSRPRRTRRAGQRAVHDRVLPQGRRRRAGSASWHPRHKFDEALRGQAPVAQVTQHIDDDQTFRYSPASGDPMPIHLDDEVAKDVRACPASSPTACAPWRSRRGRRSPRSPTATVDGSSGSRCASRSRCCPARTSPRSIWKVGESHERRHVVRLRDHRRRRLVIKDGLAVIADDRNRGERTWDTRRTGRHHHRRRPRHRPRARAALRPGGRAASSSTTSAARTTAPARTPARPSRSSTRSSPRAARRSPTPTTSRPGTAPKDSSTRRSTSSAASTSSSTTPASCATASSRA